MSPLVTLPTICGRLQPCGGTKDFATVTSFCCPGDYSPPVSRKHLYVANSADIADLNLGSHQEWFV